MNRLKIAERLMAGDVTLLRFNCPGCETEHLTGYPIGPQKCCPFDFQNCELDIRHARLLCGTRRRPGRISKRIIQMLLAIQGPCCAYCSKPFEVLNGESYHVEHICPLAAGGTNNLENLCLSCRRCNAFAGSRVFSSFAAKKEFILQRSRGDRQSSKDTF